MVKVYLEAGDSFVAASTVSVFGSTATETVTLQEGVRGIEIDSTIDTVNLSGSVESYTYKQKGIALEIYKDGTLVTSLASPDMNPVFNGNAVDIGYSAGVMDLGGNTITTTQTPILSEGVQNISADGSADASSQDAHFVFKAAGNYAFEISNFSAGDVLDFVDSRVSLENLDINDGEVTLVWNDGSTANNTTVTLTGVTTTEDANLYSIGSFDNVFGEGTII